MTTGGPPAVDSAWGGRAQMPLPRAEDWEVALLRPPAGRFARQLVEFRTNLPLAVGTLLLAGFGLVACAAVLLYGPNLAVLPEDPTLAALVRPPGPTLAHPFGVEGGIGVDVMRALFQATPWDLALVGGPILLAVAVGLLLGAYAGAQGGAADGVVTFGADLLIGVPPFFLVIVLFLGVQHLIPISDGMLAFVLLFAFVLWPYYARPVRARAQQVAQLGYVEAARAAGAPRGRLLARHVIPNSVFPVLAQVPVDVYNVFFVLTVYQYLGCFAGPGGFGGRSLAVLSPLPSANFPEWGYLLAQGVCGGWSPLAGSDFWWMYAFPAATILLFGLAVTLTCDGLQRALSRSRIT
jgi:peptide/nickel transport system permease protein